MNPPPHSAPPRPQRRGLVKGTSAPATGPVRRRPGRVGRILGAVGIAVIGMSGAGVAGALSAPAVAGAATAVPNLCTKTRTRHAALDRHADAGRVQGPDAGGGPRAVHGRQHPGVRVRRVERHDVHRVLPPLPVRPAEALLLRLRGVHRLHHEQGRPDGVEVGFDEAPHRTRLRADPARLRRVLQRPRYDPAGRLAGGARRRGHPTGDILAWQPASSDGQPNLQGVGPLGHAARRPAADPRVERHPVGDGHHGLDGRRSRTRRHPEAGRRPL